MTIKEINASFGNTIRDWKHAISDCDDASFAMRPDNDSWSIGQVCQHLIGSTERLFMVVEKCLAGDANAQELKTDAGEKAVQENTLGDIRVKLPLSVQPTPEQPQSRQAVKDRFDEFEKRFAALAEKVEASSAKGREKHPVLGFLNAKEWLHTCDMHFRHHLRQKQRIEESLKDRLAR